MSQQPNLWWSYDPDGRSFQALPAGPFFLPALILLVATSVLSRVFRRDRSREKVVGSISSTDYYKEKAERFNRLGEKRLNSGTLTSTEWREYYDLQYFLNNPHA